MKRQVKPNETSAVTDVTDHFVITVTRACVRRRENLYKQYVTSVRRVTTAFVGPSSSRRRVDRN